MEPQNIEIFLQRLGTLVQGIATVAIPVTRMSRKVSMNAALTACIVPERREELKAPVIYVQHLTVQESTQKLPSESEMSSREKSKRLAISYVRLRQDSAFDTRFEIRIAKGRYGGGFIVLFDAGALAISLSGYTEKLDEAILLKALVELGALEHEKAVEFSRPMNPEGTNKPRRNYDYFFQTVSHAWDAAQALKNETLVANATTSAAEE
ncbi:MAG: hypothetical protein NT003_02175 [Candidatus Magasanikbacteria bacterium]|nr:hypothetical protein [Candidatus Magasanikbacteria bacterium]